MFVVGPSVFFVDFQKNKRVKTSEHFGDDLGARKNMLFFWFICLFLCVFSFVTLTATTSTNIAACCLYFALTMTCSQLGLFDVFFWGDDTFS